MNQILSVISRNVSVLFGSLSVGFVRRVSQYETLIPEDNRCPLKAECASLAMALDRIYSIVLDNIPNIVLLF